MFKNLSSHFCRLWSASKHRVWKIANRSIKAHLFYDKHVIHRLLKSTCLRPLLCLLLPIIRANPLIDTRWHIKIKARHVFSRKIKVGFGPITTGEDDLAERKWRIDPIINAINALKSNYTAGFFIDPREMEDFDICIIVKKFNPSFIPIISSLKKKNKKLIYDIVDNPNSEEKYRFYFVDYPDFSNQMNAFILSSPLHQPLVECFSSESLLIEHPIIHDVYKTDYLNREEVHILAHGYYANLTHLISIEPIIREVAKETGKKIVLTYHSEEVFPDTEWIKYLKWTRENSFQQFLKADIAITNKKMEDMHQRNKPSTKVISFMAAGLPVICTPTAADRLVIEDGVTGLYAFTPLEWKQHLTELVLSAKRREQIGRAARESVLNKYSIEAITEKYLFLFNKVSTNTMT